ncbi:hypothetical protein ES703_45132 [subsurface metagenome]
MNRKVIIAIIITALLVGGGVYFWNTMAMKKMKVEKEFEFFPIYGSDEKAMNLEINYYIRIPNNLPTEEKLRILADKLSRFIFKLPIEVLRIEERKDKKIAVINLLENEVNSYFKWNSLYFQGSTGGFFTTMTLRKTFLQDSYKGNWIDGVEFYYEGEPILEEDWDHISLSGTIYRR